ncbi:MAG: ABC transporter ATP-binding protein, partial [Mogibacterium sp.]|nr:ABC transporter ATP-binding protein [Mogibacterium sp.]
MSEMNRQAAPLLKIEGGSFAYKGGPQILKDINIEVEPGEILAVLGPNGSGKTTMLRCMMDMLHWQSGRSLLDGEDIRGIPASTLWKKMAYVPQAGTAATSYTAFQTVLIGRSSRIGAFSSPTEEDMKVTERVMERLGISHLADKPCHAISGGELQMVLIARAMAAEPKLLVLDEPESNLDFKNQLIVLDTMTALAAEGVACVFNTHYPSHALQRAGKSLMLSKEGWSLFGDTTGVVTEDNIRRAFGVEALIGEVETPQNIMKNVVAVGISEEASAQEPGAADRSVLASLTVIMQNNAHA